MIPHRLLSIASALSLFSQVCNAETITLTTHISACSATYTSGTSTTVIQSTVTVQPTPWTDIAANGGAPFVLRVEQVDISGYPEQQGAAPYWLTANGNTTTNSSLAAVYYIHDGGQLSTLNGSHVATNFNVVDQAFGVTDYAMPINTTFSVRNRMLNWTNSLFTNGTAQFYKLPPGLLDNALILAKFLGPMEAQRSWSPVILWVEPVNGTSIVSTSASSGASVTPLSTASWLLSSLASSAATDTVPASEASSSPTASGTVALSSITEPAASSSEAAVVSSIVSRLSSQLSSVSSAESVSAPSMASMSSQSPPVVSSGASSDSISSSTEPIPSPTDSSASMVSSPAASMSSPADSLTTITSTTSTPEFSLGPSMVSSSANSPAESSVSSPVGSSASSPADSSTTSLPAESSVATLSSTISDPISEASSSVGSVVSSSPLGVVSTSTGIPLSSSVSISGIGPVNPPGSSTVSSSVPAVISSSASTGAPSSSASAISSSSPASSLVAISSSPVVSSTSASAVSSSAGVASSSSRATPSSSSPSSSLAAPSSSTTPASSSVPAVSSSVVAVSSSVSSSSASAAPTYVCPGDNGKSVPDAAGTYYTIGCGQDTTGGGRAVAARNSFNDCFQSCDATADCVGFTYSGAVNGAGGGTCYLKVGIQNIRFAAGRDTFVAAIRAVPAVGSSSSSSLVSSSAPVRSTTNTLATGSATTGGPASTASGTAPPTCPDMNGATITDSNGAVYSITCGSDSGGALITNVGVNGRGILECFEACDRTNGCTAFTYSGDSTMTQGTCYLKYQTGLISNNGVQTIALAILITPGQGGAVSSSVAASTTSAPATSAESSSPAASSSSTSASSSNPVAASSSQPIVPSSSSTAASSSSPSPSPSGGTVVNPDGSTSTYNGLLPSPTRCDFSDPIGTEEDDSYCQIDLPFSMQIYDKLDTITFASTNGILSLSEGSGVYDNQDGLPNRYVPNYTAFPFFDDLLVSENNLDHGIFYQITATSVTYEYRLIRGGSYETYHFTVTYDSTNPGTFVYRYYETGQEQGAGSADVGIQGLAADGRQIAVQYSHYRQDAVAPGATVTCNTLGTPGCVRS